MTTAHLKEIIGMLLIGEGVVGMVYPKRHVGLWAFGPRPWREFVEWWAERPRLLRAICAAEAAAGLWLVARQLPPLEAAPRTLAGNRERPTRRQRVRADGSRTSGVMITRRRG